MRWTGILLVVACHNGAKGSDAAGGGDGKNGSAEPTNHMVGDPCQHDADCNVDVFGMPQGECLVQSPFTGGYCSAPIDGGCPVGSGANPPCPTGTTCIARGIPQTLGQSFCIKNCRTNSDCRTRDGYTCCTAVLGQSGPYCWPSALCM